MHPNKFTDIESYRNCRLCPRECGVDRFQSASGWCRSDANLHIASICCHTGEEPLVGGKSGICNVFFSHCNLQCVFCQNHQISNNANWPEGEITDMEKAVEQILHFLEGGCHSLGFVSPTHFVPHMVALINRIHQKGKYPIIVYNSNGFDKPEVLKELEGLIDIYLPDFKYAENQLALSYSNSDDYVISAKLSLKEMFRQKGSVLRMRDEEQAESGLIIRHLVLPGHVSDSCAVLQWITEELSPRLQISLMAQYHPAHQSSSIKTLNRTILASEYQSVLDFSLQLGFENIEIQSLDAHEDYLPDFEKEEPFRGKRGE